MRFLHKGIVVSAVGAMGTVFGCAGEPVPDVSVVQGPPGSPLPGLDQIAFDRFERGRQLFDRPFSPEEGLGPLYNQDRCSSCHDLPVIGGSGTETATIATRFIPPNSCDPLVHEGGSNVQQRSTPLLRSMGVLREGNPPSASVRTSVTAPSLFGLGLVEAVPLSVLERWADPDDADGDGISGRVGRTEDGRPARFGRKSEFASIEEFVDGALRFEMGLTTPSHPSEETLNGTPLPLDVDPAADPEMTQDQVLLLTDFIRFLSPLEPANPTSEAHQSNVARGEALFAGIGCSQCHVPTLTTGSNTLAALDGQAFYVYSDMLLHDLGSDLASFCGAGARPSEFRTARLTGLRYRDRYLHDGSAGSVWSAVVAHAGEATRAKEAFMSLGSRGQEAILQFIFSR